MIKVTVKEAAIRAGITTAYQLQKAAEISPAVAADLWKGKKARLDTFDHLCEVLKCELGDLVSRYKNRSPKKRR